MTTPPPDPSTPDARPAGLITDLYGTGPTGRPNTQAAAQALGVSRRTIQRWIKAGTLPAKSRGAGRLTRTHQQWQTQQAAQAAALSQPPPLWQALRKTREDTSPAAMIASLYGTGPTGRPNTQAAAQALGVSQRTIQRWIRTGILPPTSRHARQVTGTYQQWRTSPAGRAAAISPQREARLRNRGTSMIFLGKIAISNDPRNNTTRSVTVDINGTAMARILDAALAGDDTAAHAALEDAFGQAFGGSLALDISSLTTYR